MDGGVILCDPVNDQREREAPLARAFRVLNSTELLYSAKSFFVRFNEGGEVYVWVEWNKIIIIVGGLT